MTAVPPRPAAGDPDFPYMLADTPEEFERVRTIGRPVAPDVSTDTGALREEVAAAIYDERNHCHLIRMDWSAHFLASYLAEADAILATPALRDLIAERDDLAAKVGRVRALADQYRTLGAVLHSVLTAEAYRDVADGLLGALDGTQ